MSFNTRYRVNSAFKSEAAYLQETTGLPIDRIVNQLIPKLVKNPELLNLLNLTEALTDEQEENKERPQA